MLRPLCYAGYTVSWLLIAACGGQTAINTPIEETWSFSAGGTVMGVGTNGDSLEVSLRDGEVVLVRSNRRQGGTVRFALLSGISIGQPGRTVSTDLTPGNGYTVGQGGAQDSIYFFVGSFTFRGLGDDVYMSGSWEADPADTTMEWATEGSPFWRMARQGVPEAELVRNTENWLEELRRRMGN